MNSTVKLSDAQRQHLLAWVEDLESGEHQQTKGVLAQKNPSVPGGIKYCCVGRLCEVAIANGVALERRQDPHLVNYGYVTPDAGGPAASAHTAHVVPRVELWSGLTNRKLEDYAFMNDNGQTFLQIATQIRKDFDLGPRDA